MAEVKRVLLPGGLFIGSVNGVQALAVMRNTAVELEPHYYWNIDRHIRLFDRDDLQQYLDIFETCRIDERAAIRFGNVKNYLVFVAEKARAAGG